MDLTSYFGSPERKNDQNLPQPIIIKGAVRNDLPAYFASRGFKTGAELGVCQGNYSVELCRGIPELKLFCVDAWTSWRDKNGRKLAWSAKRNFRRAKESLAPFNTVILKGLTVEMAKQVPDNSLDFIYVDADHRLPAIIADLAAWEPKVKIGGIIAGHDWHDVMGPHNHTPAAIRAWTEAYGITPWYVLGRFKRRLGEAGELYRTWMYEKRYDPVT